MGTEPPGLAPGTGGLGSLLTATPSCRPGFQSNLAPLPRVSHLAFVRLFVGVHGSGNVCSAGDCTLWGVPLVLTASVRKRGLWEGDHCPRSQQGSWNLGQGLDFSHCWWPDVQGGPRAHRLAAVTLPQAWEQGERGPRSAPVLGVSVLPALPGSLHQVRVFWARSPELSP